MALCHALLLPSQWAYHRNRWLSAVILHDTIIAPLRHHFLVRRKLLQEFLVCSGLSCLCVEELMVGLGELGVLRQLATSRNSNGPALTLELMIFLPYKVPKAEPCCLFESSLGHASISVPNLLLLLRISAILHCVNTTHPATLNRCIWNVQLRLDSRLKSTFGKVNLLNGG